MRRKQERSKANAADDVLLVTRGEVDLISSEKPGIVLES